MPSPTVSVVMGTYNHAPFVAEAIDSVLAQDFGDFEFLIADDGSADQTPDIVSRYSDPRIRFQRHAGNRGAALVLQELVGQARGRYVAVINSDDSWLPGKLSEQIGILSRSSEIGAVFGRVRFVDRDGRPIEKDALRFGHVFDQQNRSRGEWLKYFFFHGNCLCHPSVLIRRELYDRAGSYDNRLRQLPDFDMWIRLVKQSDIFISENDMVNFRIMPGENTSSDIYTNRVRTLNEHFFIALDFFSGVSGDLLRQGFGERLKYPDLPSEAHVAIEQALLFLQPVLSLTHVHQIVAMLKLRALLADPTSRAVLQKDYDFDERALHRLAAEADGLQAHPPIIQPVCDRDVSRLRTIELGQIILERFRTRLRMLARR